MKRILVEVEKPIKINEERWEAIDGTVFDDCNAAYEYEDGYRDGLIKRLGMKYIYCPFVFDKHFVSSLDFHVQYIWLPKSTEDIVDFFSIFLNHERICWGDKLDLGTKRKVIISYSEDDGYGIDFYDDIRDYAIKKVKDLEEIGAMV